MRSRSQQSRGFNLIELVVVMVVIGIIAVAIAPIAATSLQAYNKTLDTLSTLDKLRYATERITREVREVDYIKPEAAPSYYDFVTMGASSVEFKRNYLEGTSTTARTVTISQSGANVTINYGTGAQILTDQVSSLAFRYCQADGITCTATTTANVRYVEIVLVLTLDGNDYPQRTRVELKSR